MDSNYIALLITFIIISCVAEIVMLKLKDDIRELEKRILRMEYEIKHLKGGS